MTSAKFPRLGATRGLLFVGLLVFAMGQTILFAVMGPVARAIGMAEWQVGVVTAASAFTVMLVSPAWGRLSDKWGRKRVIVLGLAAYGLVTALFAGVLAAGLAGLVGAAIVFALLVAVRVLYAVTTSGIQPSAVALMADLSVARDRSAAIALVGAAFGLGTVLGPALAAALVGFGVLTPLFAAAGAAVLIALLAAGFMVNPPRAMPEEGQDQGAAGLPRGFAVPLFLTFLTYVAIASIQQTAAFFIQDFSGTAAAEAARLAGYAFVALALAMLLVQGGLVQALKPPPARMVAAGLPVASTGIALCLAAPSYGWIIAAFAIMGAGFALVQPGISALVSLATGTEVQGRAAGFVQAAMAGGFVVGPLLGTALYGLAPAAPLWLALTSLAMCAGLFLWHSRRAVAKRTLAHGKAP
jgi:MFS family permease